VVKALWAIARHGMPTLRQAVAGGQYDFPRGLFYGGDAPSRSHDIMRDNIARWLHGSQSVVHLDLHTGLGPRGVGKLLIDYPLSESQRAWLTEWMGAGAFVTMASGRKEYSAQGGFGQWCVSRQLAPNYLSACAEFGTYGPISVIAGLRAENQAHHWGDPSAASAARAKQRLKKLFCPSAEAWRSEVLSRSFDFVSRALRGLAATG
jgi:hypothetical protein